MDRYLVVGLGTGRCGSVSLQKMLNQLDSSFVTHEGFMLPWYGNPDEAVRKMRLFLRETDKVVVGDVGFYWLPYVDSMISAFPEIKFICLKRGKDETVRSYDKKTEGRNHWIQHDGTVWQRDVQWDRCYPKFNAASKIDALEQYWDMYYETAARLEREYSDSFRVFDIDVLSSSDNFKKVLEFIGVKNQIVEPVRENVLLANSYSAARLVNEVDNISGQERSAGDPSVVKRTYWRLLERRKVLSNRINKKLRQRGDIINTIVAAPLRRTCILRAGNLIESGDDITAVVAIRDVEPFRLYHALQSIQAQDYDFGRVDCVVVDYGSSDDMRPQFRKLTEGFGFNYIYIDEKGAWNRSKALNAGIRRANTKFVVSTDVDIIFSPSFFSEAVKALKKKPCAVVYSYCLDLPEELNKLLLDKYRDGTKIDIDELKSAAVRRWNNPSRGIHITYRRYYDLVRGYDENYVEWGAEDEDLYHRFVWLGLDPIVVYSDNVFYCHVWHEKWGGVITERRYRLMEQNARYLTEARGIRRNDVKWGIHLEHRAE